MNEGHFKDLLFELVPPPAQQASTRVGSANPRCGFDDDGISYTSPGRVTAKPVCMSFRSQERRLHMPSVSCQSLRRTD